MSHAKPMAFDVVDTGEVALQTHTACVVGDDFAINADLLTRAIAQPLEPIDHDVLLVIAAVCLVDRSVRRTNGTGWCRRLSIRVPVLKLHTWQHARTSLETLLARLTGDAWTFDFRQRQHIPQAQGHFEIDQDHLQGSIVVPYSEGLDSFAAVAMLRVENPDAKVLLLNVRPSKKASKQLFRSSPTQTIGIPVTFTQKDHRELSYRTRTFQYFGVAALVWHKTKASKIVIGESGIGCLGPGLVPVGVEQPVRGNSPFFIADLKEFFHQLWDRTPVFEFLNLWRTKAMALAKSKPNLGGWQPTTSCSRMVRRQHPGATARQCGLCSGCVFRRMSVLAAGLKESSPYFVDILSESSLRDDLKSSDRSVARASIVTMNELALLADKLDDVDAEIALIARALGESQQRTRENLESLLLSYQQEWHMLLANLPQASWVREIVYVQSEQ